MTSMYTNKTLSLSLFLILYLSVLSYAISPGDENPTDLSVSSQIQSANFTIKKNENLATIIIEIKGLASAETHHCGIAFIITYKNGTTNYDGLFYPGPSETMQNNRTIIFQPNNNLVWDRWTYYSTEIIHKDDLGIQKNDIDDIQMFEVWVRAYSTEDESQWNQTHIILTNQVLDQLKAFYGISDSVFSPLLVFFLIVVVIASVFLLLKNFYFKNKTNKK